jgi:hypothetical protein
MPETRPRWSTGRRIAVGAAAASAVALGTGIVLGVQARSRRDQAFALCPEPAAPCDGAARADALTSAGHSRALAADVGFGIAGAAALAASALWLTGAPETAQRVTIAPALSRQQATLTWTGSF